MKVVEPLDLDAEHSADLRIVDEVIVRLRSRMATCDDAEIQAVGGLLLKYLERRAAMLGLDRKDKPAPAGSIAAVTQRLGIVPSVKKDR